MKFCKTCKYIIIKDKCLNCKNKTKKNFVSKGNFCFIRDETSILNTKIFNQKKGVWFLTEEVRKNLISK